MTDKEINEAIAFERGWKQETQPDVYPEPLWYSPDGYLARAVAPDFITDGDLMVELLAALAAEGDDPMLDYEGGWNACGKFDEWALPRGVDAGALPMERYPDPARAVAMYYAKKHGLRK